MKKVEKFRGEFRFLSNFEPCEVVFEGETYPSTEHAYQAAKTLDTRVRKLFLLVDAGKAKQAGKKLKVREDWAEVRVSIMEGLMRQKFAPGTPLASKLVALKDYDICEGNYWHDNFWGSCTCAKCADKGENVLGKLLMRLRDELLST
jgi:ribA/ribD-fused uncharacterized protein